MRKANKKVRVSRREINRLLDRLLKSGLVGVIAKEAGKKVGKAVVKQSLMAIVKTFGKAGTGKAISALSGAAAGNATVAWFGFGSMFIGEIVLSILAAVVIWLVVRLLSESYRRFKNAPATRRLSPRHSPRRFLRQPGRVVRV